MIIIENGLVLFGEHMNAIKANIAIEDNEIIEISKNKVNNGKKIDARGCIVAPSFINSHVHMGDSIARDVGDGKSIDEIVKPPYGLKHRILSQSPPSKIMDGMNKSMKDMLESGTATFVDFREGGLEGIQLIDEAAKNVLINKIVLGRDNSFLDPDTKKSDIKKATKNLLKVCDGVGLSGFGEIKDETAALIAKICKKQGKISAIHVAEYEELQNESVELTGKSEVQRAIDSNFDVLIHLTAPIGDDLDLLSNSNCSVVCCPRSNGTLAVGIPPLMDLLKHKINVLLGTDNIMFNSPNMLREMEYALKITRGYYREYFPPLEILKMATVNAAKAFNLNSGSIEEGKKADLLIIKKISDDPIVSIINRTELKHIKYSITEGNIAHINR